MSRAHRDDVAVEVACCGRLALVNALALDRWRCPRCEWNTARTLTGSRWTLGPYGALPDDYEPFIVDASDAEQLLARELGAHRVAYFPEQEEP